MFILLFCGYFVATTIVYASLIVLMAMLTRRRGPTLAVALAVGLLSGWWLASTAAYEVAPAANFFPWAGAEGLRGLAVRLLPSRALAGDEQAYPWLLRSPHVYALVSVLFWACFGEVVARIVRSRRLGLRRPADRLRSDLT